MTSNISLSPHFCLDEFTKSSTAMKHGIKNEPAPEQVDNLKALCQDCLEPLREALGLPVVITSGYRTKALNSMLAHSSERSQHMLGQAADFYVAPGQSGLSRRELLIKAFRLIILDESIDYDQLHSLSLFHSREQRIPRAQPPHHPAWYAQWQAWLRQVLRPERAQDRVNSSSRFKVQGL